MERVTDMTLEMLKSKIHRATVTQAELNYVGSITIDEELMEAAGIREYEKVQIADVDNGARFETYVIAGDRGGGTICLNGAAARMVSTGADDARGGGGKSAEGGVCRRKKSDHVRVAL